MTSFFYKKGMVHLGFDPAVEGKALILGGDLDAAMKEGTLDESVLPQNPPPPEVITYAERAAEDLGVSVSFIIIVADISNIYAEGDGPAVMTWAVRVTTQRGVVEGVPFRHDVAGWGDALARVGLLAPDAAWTDILRGASE